MRQVVLIAGPPCSGKTTLAHQLARAGGLVLDRDEIARGLGSPHQWFHDEALTEQAEQIMRREIARIGAAADITAYVVRSVPTPGQRVDLANRLGASTVYLLNPGLAECMRRAHAEGRPHATAAAIRTWYRRYRPSGLDTTPGAAPISTSRAW